MRSQKRSAIVTAIAPPRRVPILLYVPRPFCRPFVVVVLVPEFIRLGGQRESPLSDTRSDKSPGRERGRLVDRNYESPVRSATRSARTQCSGAVGDRGARARKGDEDSVVRKGQGARTHVYTYTHTHSGMGTHTLLVSYNSKRYLTVFCCPFYVLAGSFASPGFSFPIALRSGGACIIILALPSPRLCSLRLCGIGPLRTA